MALKSAKKHKSPWCGDDSYYVNDMLDLGYDAHRCLQCEKEWVQEHERAVLKRELEKAHQQWQSFYASISYS